MGLCHPTLALLSFPSKPQSSSTCPFLTRTNSCSP
jgi:hypothetical protein